MTERDQKLTLPANPAYGEHARNRRQWMRWLAPRASDRIALFLYLSTPLVFIHKQFTPTHIGEVSWWVFAALSCAIVGLIAIDRWEYWRYSPAVPPPWVAAALLLLRLGLLELVARLDGHLSLVSGMLYLTLPYAATTSFGRGIGKWVAGFTWLWLIIKLTWLRPEWYLEPAAVDDIVILSLTIAFVITAARVVKQEMMSRLRAERLLADLEVSHQKLTEYATQVADMATVTERNRLARDIHDCLGHYLTVINIQLEKAVAFREKNPTAAEEAVLESKRLAHEALNDVRRSVGTLRSAELFSLHAALTDLVAPLQSNQLTIDLTIEGREEDFPRQTLLTLYRAAQEGLTNIQRHAQASYVTIAVRFGTEEARLSINDNGVGFNVDTFDLRSSGASGRYGLRGVQERLELIGGMLHISSEPGKGTAMTITVSKDPMTKYRYDASQTEEVACYDEHILPRRSLDPGVGRR